MSIPHDRERKAEEHRRRAAPPPWLLFALAAASILWLLCASCAHRYTGFDIYLEGAKGKGSRPIGDPRVRGAASELRGGFVWHFTRQPEEARDDDR